MVVHGESGVGKSWLADSAPAPRLILDVEGGVNFTPSEKVEWDPRNEPPTADSVVVHVRDLKAVQDAFAWLNSGKHSFRSVVIDSLSEMQKRAIDNIAGTAQLKTQDWGTLLRKMEGMVRAFRDLTTHPAKPVENVVFVCGTKVEGETGRLRPNLQGQMGTTLPYYVDVVAYMAYAPGDEVGEYVRRAAFLPLGDVVAKDRTGKLGPFMDDPTIPRIREEVYREENE
jgi:AAA domain-containing protein